VIALGASIQIKVEVSGEELLLNALQRMAVTKSSAAHKALMAEAEDLKRRSQQQVPTETGTLHDTAYIEDKSQGRNDITIRVGYGGPNDKINPKTRKAASSYAVIVHERLDVSHPKGKAKFLEDPANQLKRELASRLAKRLRRSV
jgi:hypothetical protein